MKDYMDMTAAELAAQANLEATPMMNAPGGAAGKALLLIEALATRVVELEQRLRHIASSAGSPDQ